jgi:hypothetical protein
MLAKVRRWQPEREITLVGDGSYAAVVLVQRCQRLKKPVQLVSRLRLDARLFDFPGPQPASKRGPKPKKGARLTQLAERLTDPETHWRELAVILYGQEHRLQVVTGGALWHTPGQDPVPLRWVLVRCPEGSCEPAAFCCSDPTATPKAIIVWASLRWNIGRTVCVRVTFAELRAQLGFETQRQWADRAIERPTPSLLGLFSLVTLMAKSLHPDHLPIRQTSGYVKEEASFSAALAAVRSHFWKGSNSVMSTENHDLYLIPQTMLLSLLDAACYST